MTVHLFPVAGGHLRAYEKAADPAWGISATPGGPPSAARVTAPGGVATSAAGSLSSSHTDAESPQDTLPTASVAPAGVPRLPGHLPAASRSTPAGDRPHTSQSPGRATIPGFVLNGTTLIGEAPENIATAFGLAKRRAAGITEWEF